MNSSSKKLLFALFLQILIQFDATAQFSMRTISQKLANALPEEKIYLTFNKPYYMAGETVYFKAFAVMANNHKTDTLSSILYIDFIDADTKTLKARKTLPINNSVAYGSFDTDSTQAVNLKIIAYTKWMLNFSTQYMFQKTIPILTYDSKPFVDSEIKDNGIKVWFFPEGGNSVLGLAAYVAVKSTDDKGLGISVQGKIVDEMGAFVDSFSTSSLGFGRFIFKPIANKSYKAIVSMGKNTQEFPLPKAVEQGFTMLIDPFTDSTKILAHIQTNLLDAQMPDNLFLIGHIRGVLSYGTKIDIKDKTNKFFYFEIPKNKFQQEGIIHLTLFDGNGIPLAERLVFNENPAQRVKIQAKTDKNVYKPKEKIELVISTHDGEGKPISSNASVSVIDAEKIALEDNAENLLTYLLLNSDLGGTIEKPYAFLRDTTFFTRQNRDWLMMTHGWRRFVWKELLGSKKTPPQYLIESGFSFKGKVTDVKKPNKLISNQNLLLTLKDKNIGNDQTLLIETDSLGNFSLENLLINDSTDCFIKISDYKRPYNAKIEYDTTPSVFHSFLKDSHANFMADNSLDAPFYALKNFGRESNKTISLDTFTVKDRQIVKRDARKLYYDKPNASVKIEQGTTANTPTLVEYLNGREGLKMFMDGGTLIIRPFRGFNTFKPQEENAGLPLVMVDAMPATPQALLYIPFSAVEKVDIIRSANALYGARGANGVINIITKNGKGLSNAKMDNTETELLPKVKLKGFSIVREFYSPDYSDINGNSKVEDLRSSLYWGSNVKTDENGKTSIIFYNSDDCKKGKIIVQCVDAEGRIGYLLKEY